MMPHFGRGFSCLARIGDPVVSADAGQSLNRSHRLSPLDKSRPRFTSSARLTASSRLVAAATVHDCGPTLQLHRG